MAKHTHELHGQSEVCVDAPMVQCESQQSFGHVITSAFCFNEFVPASHLHKHDVQLELEHKPGTMPVSKASCLQTKKRLITQQSSF